MSTLAKRDGAGAGIAGPGLLETIRTQSRIISALVVRETYTRFGRENIGFLWVIVEPGVFCVAVVILWSVIRHSEHAEVPLVPFTLTGYMPLLLFRHMGGRLLRCMQANAGLLYHRRITILALYSARMIVEILGNSTAFFFLLVVFYLFGFVKAPDNVGFMVGGWFLHLRFCIGVALVIGALSERTEMVDKIWSPISYVMIPLSGAFTMLYWLPGAFQEALLWSPMVSCLELMRKGYFGDGVPTYYALSYVVYFNTIATVAGLYLLKDVRKHVEIE